MNLNNGPNVHTSREGNTRVKKGRKGEKEGNVEGTGLNEQGNVPDRLCILTSFESSNHSAR